VNAELARLPKTQRATVGTGVITQERTDRVAALAAALSTRIAFDRLLSQISRVLPADAWLTGLTASSPSVPTTTIGVSGAPQPSSTSGPQGVTIEGATYSQESVARVLSRLAVVPTLQNVRLTASAIVEPSSQSQPGSKPASPKGKHVVTFSIAADLRTGASS